MSMDKRKTTGELLEEVRQKRVAKRGQSQGFKFISRDLDVVVSSLRNVIKKFKAHATVGNLPGRGQLDGRLQQRIVGILEKAPGLTTTQIQADLQRQGTKLSTHIIGSQINERGVIWLEAQEYPERKR